MSHLRLRHLFFPPTASELSAILANDPQLEAAFEALYQYDTVTTNIASGRPIAIHTIKYLLNELREDKKRRATYWWRISEMVGNVGRSVGLVGPSPVEEPMFEEEAYTPTSSQRETKVSTIPISIDDDDDAPQVDEGEQVTPDTSSPSSFDTKSIETEEITTPPAVEDALDSNYIERTQTSPRVYENIGTLAEMLQQMEMNDPSESSSSARKRLLDGEAKSDEVTYIDGVPVSIVRANEHLARAMGRRQTAGSKRVVSAQASKCATPIQDINMGEDSDEDRKEGEEEKDSDDDSIIFIC